MFAFRKKQSVSLLVALVFFVFFWKKLKGTIKNRKVTIYLVYCA